MVQKRIGSTFSTMNVITLSMTVVLFITFSAGACYADDPSTATVGMSARIDQVILPGSELKVKDIKEGDPIVLRHPL